MALVENLSLGWRSAICSPCSEPGPVNPVPPEMEILPQPLGVCCNPSPGNPIHCLNPALSQLGLACPSWGLQRKIQALQETRLSLISTAVHLFADGFGRAVAVTEWPEGHRWGQMNPMLLGLEVLFPLRSQGLLGTQNLLGRFCYHSLGSC